MTLFAIHDEIGRINQANKVFVSPEELKKYEALLRDWRAGGAGLAAALDLHKLLRFQERRLRCP